MYSNLYRLCNYSDNRPRVITTNTHFISPSSSIYDERSVNVSRPNFAPSAWGPGAWDFLFTVAKAYPDSPSYSEKLKMRRFLESLDYCLPCEKCRDNFACEVGKLEDRDLQNSRSVILWLKDLRMKIRERKMAGQ